MPRMIARAAAAALALAGACSDPADVQLADTSATIAVLNGSADWLDLQVDDGSIEPVGPSVVTPRLHLDPGVHQIRLKLTGAIVQTISVTFTVASPARYNLLAFQAPGAGDDLNAAMLADTGSAVPAGKSKLRVVHLAANAPDINIWRTQPDFPEPTHIVTPFEFSAEPTAYIQSDAGTWTVWITPVDDDDEVLATTGPIEIPSGRRRTVALVDSAGFLRLRVLEE